MSTAKRSKLSIPENVIKTIKCCLNANHYISDANLLPCGGNACSVCLDTLVDSTQTSIECKFCNTNHNKGDILKIRQPNPAIQILIETFISDLKEQMSFDLKDTLEAIKDESLLEQIEIRMLNIEFELDVRIESVIAKILEYREEMKREMDKMKEKLMSAMNKFKLLRRKLDDEIKNPSSDYDSFVRTNSLVNESKMMLQKYTDRLNQMKLLPPLKTVFKDIIGEIEIPIWKKSSEVEEIEIPRGFRVADLVYNDYHNNLIISDTMDHAIYYIFLNGAIEQLKHSKILYPRAICTLNGKVFVCVTDPQPKILVFGKERKYEREFKIIGSVFETKMSIDTYEKSKNLLYMVDYLNCKVAIWHINTGQLFRVIDIETPRSIEFSDGFIYVSSPSDFTVHPTTGEFECTTKGANCVFILNKRNYEIIDKIKFNDWLQPNDLFFDNKRNLIARAFEIDRNNVVSNQSCLHVINSNKEMVTKIGLARYLTNSTVSELCGGSSQCLYNMDEKCCHILFHNNKLIILYGNKIKVTDFTDFE